MSGISSWGVFVTGAVLIIVAPGPDFVYVMTQGVARGRWSGVLSAWGIGIGLLIHTTLAALGLAALILTSPFAFDAIKYVGAVYLGYLGLKSLRSHGILSKSTLSNSPEAGSVRVLRQGVFTNLFNPKAVLTFLAFIPQFVTAGSHSGSQVVFLGGSMALLGIGWFSIVGYFSGIVGEWLLNSKSARLINHLMGCVLISLGIRLALLAH